MAQSDPLVTVIVPHHLNENDEYLYWCLYSIANSRGVSVEIICISDAEVSPISAARVIHDRSLNNVTKKWHHGVKLANPASKYVMLISDDVVVSKYTIAHMARTIGDAQMILSPASNCDATTRYRTTFTVGYAEVMCMDIPHKCTLSDIKGYEQAVIDYPASKSILIDPGWVSFYCTMFPKTVLERVGDFDESLDVRYNDVDYCQRARAMGIPSLIDLGCFALHFGDRTLPKVTTPEDYAKADEAYRQKYAQAVT